MVIDLYSSNIVVWNVYFFAIFISFKYDFHVDAEFKIVRHVKKYLRRWFKKKIVWRENSSADIYRSRFTIS